MTPQRAKFALGLAEGLSQAAAYRRAYPKSKKWKDATVWEEASRVAANPEVRARVAELGARALSAADVTMERIALELARIAFVDVRKLVGPDGRPLPLQDLDDDTARAIVGLDVATVGNMDMDVGEVMKFKLGDKKGALELLGRKVGMFEKDNEQGRHVTRVVIVPGKVAPGEADDGPGG